MVRGRNISTGKLDTVRITPEGVGEGDEVWQGVYNPSFDVTPAELISESTLSGSGMGVRGGVCEWSVRLTGRLRGHGEGGG